jgi:hypothetical protein
VFSTSREDQKIIAQSRRLRWIPWPGMGSSEPVPQRPLTRLQHLSWMDPNMHRAQAERALKECEWKHGEVSSLRKSEHFLGSVTFFSKRSRNKRPGSPRIDDREIPRLKLPGQNGVWAPSIALSRIRQGGRFSATLHAKPRAVCAPRTRFSRSRTAKGDASCDPRRCPPLIASRSPPPSSPILPARRARRMLQQRSSGPSPGRGPPRRSDVDFQGLLMEGIQEKRLGWKEEGRRGGL